MEQRTLLLYLSVVLNLVLSCLVALRESPGSPTTLLSQAAPSSRCCPCPAATPTESFGVHGEAAPTATSATAPEPATAEPRGPPTRHTVTDGRADFAFGGSSKAFETDSADAVVYKPSNASFDFMDQPCSQRRIRPGLYFIDLGANCGNSYELFLRRLLPTIHRADRATALRAFLFEFNPRMHREFLERLERSDPRVKLMKAAAHVHDGFFTAYLDNRKEAPGQFKCVATPGARNPAGASTLVGAMPRAGQPIRVQAINVAGFLGRTFCKGDSIHLKMDIEGFEYPLLSALIEQNVHCLVTAYYIEFHYKLPKVEFLGRNMTPVAAAGEARRRLRECAVVREWF
eukprot:GGOE01040950.1.p1 GENE.GGOE01040950.1~~GGOE01040950.1.p1  ORF type:complete len:370 (+),score=85.51 GGOE01040950.1:81-1112(+)